MENTEIPKPIREQLEQAKAFLDISSVNQLLNVLLEQTGVDRAKLAATVICQRTPEFNTVEIAAGACIVIVSTIAAMLLHNHGLFDDALKIAKSQSKGVTN